MPLASTVNAATAPNAANSRLRKPRRHQVEIAIFIMLALAKAGMLRRGRATLRAAPLLGLWLLEPGDRLEGAVGLNHGEEHLIRAAVAGCRIGELEAAEVEAAALLHGFDEGLPGGLAVDLLE